MGAAGVGRESYRVFVRSTSSLTSARQHRARNVCLLHGFPAPVTVSGGPGIVVTNVWSHGVLTISAD